MEIDEKYLNLLHILIYDKRTNENGIISSFVITQYIGGIGFSYQAYMNGQKPNATIFVEDFEKGNVVFLLPFGTGYMDKEMEEMAEQHTKRIKEFFGDKFRDDMIVRISEDERQAEIRKWKEIMLGLENWDMKSKRKG